MRPFLVLLFVQILIALGRASRISKEQLAGGSTP